MSQPAHLKMTPFDLILNELNPFHTFTIFFLEDLRKDPHMAPIPDFIGPEFCMMCVYCPIRVKYPTNLSIPNRPNDI